MYQGHFNTKRKDHDDICTHFGLHDRVMTTLPQYDEGLDQIALYARIDHVWGLGMPTDDQILDICRKHDNTKGKWKLAKQESDVNSINHKPCTHVWFIK